VSLVIGREQGKTIVQEYDKKNLISSTILKYYYHLHPLVESKGVLLMKRLKSKRVWIFLK
jgi:hypothetical protein